MSHIHFQRIICTAILAMYCSFVSAQWSKTSTFRGDKLVSDAKFIEELHRTCTDTSDFNSCALNKLKVNYYDMFHLMKDQTVVPLFDNGDLALKLIKKKSKDSEYVYEVLLLTFLKNEKVDSLSCYQYSNIPENSLANETIYYISEDFQLWMLSLEYEESSINTSSWIERKINPKTGKISH
ncbi:MAG: hypothetical protein ACKOXP_09210 [Flavobacteriales bacterium]